MRLDCIEGLLLLHLSVLEFLKTLEVVLLKVNKLRFNLCQPLDLFLFLLVLLLNSLHLLLLQEVVYILVSALILTIVVLLLCLVKLALEILERIVVIFLIGICRLP